MNEQAGLRESVIKRLLRGGGVAPDLPRQFCRGLVRLKPHFHAAKIFYDLRLDLRFVWYNGCELGDKDMY